jgi:uncharacterized coiled-coil DUF342 family protein
LTKREKLNEQIKRTRSNALSLKKERDALNRKVKEFKEQSNCCICLLSEKKLEEKQVREKIQILFEKLPSKTFATLQTKADSIEWKIQTTSFSVEQERKLVDQRKKLEIQLNLYRKLKRLKKTYLKIREERTCIETKYYLYKKKKGEAAQKSRKIHELLIEKIKVAQQIKAEADETHSSFVGTKENIQSIQKKLLKVFHQHEQLKKKRENENEKRRATLRAKLEKQAEQKFKNGKKITWEEFKLLGEM